MKTSTALIIATARRRKVMHVKTAKLRRVDVKGYRRMLAISWKEDNHDIRRKDYKALSKNDITADAFLSILVNSKPY